MLGGVRHEVIEANHAGQRLDNFMMGLPEKPPRGLVYRLIRTGQVRINGKRAKPMAKLAMGDDVRIPPLEPAGQRSAPNERTRKKWGDWVAGWTLVETDGWLAINKPAGLAMHAGSGVDVGLIDMIQANQPHWQLVHRLDRATSGVVLVAKTRQELIRLQDLWRDRLVDKRYLALLEGEISESQTIVDQPLKKIRDHSGQHRVVPDPQGQTAKTTFIVQARYVGYTHVEAVIETGRMHQIRAHAKAIGHAVVGDERYNESQPPASLKRLFLHAHQLTLPAPDACALIAPLPVELVQCLDRLDQA